YSVKASTAYWLQVGTKRHVAGRSGDTMCRYSWIRNTSPRTVALPAPLIAPHSRADRFTGPFPPIRKHVASRAAVVAPTGPTTPAGCWVTPGSRPGRLDADRPAWFGRHGGAGAQRGDVRPLNRPAWR